MKDREIISNRFVSLFSNWPLLAGFIIAFFTGLYMLFFVPEKWWIGLIAVIISSIAISFNYGTDVDLAKGCYREFTSIFMVKSGQWKSLEKYPYLTILKPNQSRRALSIRGALNYHKNASGPAESMGEFAVYFLDRSHYKKVMVSLHNDMGEAKKQLEKLSAAMKKEIVTYNPVRTSNTK